MNDETTTTTTATDNDATLPETATEQPNPTSAAEPSAEGPDRPEREAARYRRQLRETQAERDTLQSRLETLQRAEAERIAKNTISNGSGLWAAGTQVADLLDDDGNVDQAKVSAAAAAARDSLGLASTRALYVPREGTTSPNIGGASSWAEALRPGN